MHSAWWALWLTCWASPRSPRTPGGVMTITADTTAPTAVVDVNEQFRAEQVGRIEAQRTAVADAAARREAQLASFRERVAAGEMAEDRPGVFRALTGWDAGEVWNVRTNLAGQTLILPQHGLAERGGAVSLYTKAPMWHSLGNFIPAGLSDVELVLKASGLHYLVRKEQATRPRNGVRTPVDGHFWTIREDSDEVVGHVGRDYTVIQNAQQFAFLQELVDMTAGTDTPVVWETAGELANGRIFVSLRLGDDIIIEVDGYEDRIRPFLSAINSHDGSIKFTVTVSPWRIGCGNTERFNVRDAVTKWSTPHTANVRARLAEARKTLKLSSDYYRSWEAEQQALARVRMLTDEFAQFAAEFNDEFWPIKLAEDETEPSVRAANGRQRRIDAMVDAYEQQLPTLGRTGYAAERAMTQWLDHTSGVRVPKSLTEDMARAAKVIEGGNDTKKAHVHDKLM